MTRNIMYLMPLPRRISFPIQPLSRNNRLHQHNFRGNTPVGGASPAFIFLEKQHLLRDLSGESPTHWRPDRSTSRYDSLQPTQPQLENAKGPVETGPFKPKRRTGRTGSPNWVFARRFANRAETARSTCKILRSGRTRQRLPWPTRRSCRCQQHWSTRSRRGRGLRHGSTRSRSLRIQRRRRGRTRLQTRQRGW